MGFIIKVSGVHLTADKFSQNQNISPPPKKYTSCASSVCMYKYFCVLCVCMLVYVRMFPVYRNAENVYGRKTFFKHHLGKYFLPHFRIFQIRTQKCARMTDFLASISDAFSSITIFQSFNDWIRQRINKMSDCTTIPLQSYFDQG